MAQLSVLTAFLNEAESLPAFRTRLLSVLDELPIDIEIVLIDDHSTDGCSDFARRWADEDSRVKYLRLSHSCGSHAAFSAGLAHCTGDTAVLLAADLQDPPETIPLLLAQWREGNDVVWAAREKRLNESWTTTTMSSIYYWFMRRFALPDMPSQGADFLLMDRKVIDAYNAIPEKNTSFLALILWMGFRQTTIGYVKQARHSGRSKWNLSKKIKLFIDSMVSFSYMPIRLMSLLGVLASTIGCMYAVFVIIHALLGEPIQGWSSLIVVVLVLGGLQLLMLGVLGEYLWRTFDESRGRPRYIIEEITGADPNRYQSTASRKEIPVLTSSQETNSPP